MKDLLNYNYYYFFNYEYKNENKYIEFYQPLMLCFTDLKRCIRRLERKDNNV